MSLPGKRVFSVEPLVQTAEEPDARANRKHILSVAIFVLSSVAVSSVVYLLTRPPNRHLDPTPYDSLISQLRSSMPEDDVLALFRSASEGTARAEFRAYDEISSSGKRRVITYRIGSDEPLTVKLGGPTGRTVSEWCYRDNCHDDIE
jgi:hypothetical protein